MIRVCCSNRTEALLSAFVRNLQQEREEVGPLSPVQVVVPNRNVETYLRMGVARACGIAANLQITFLRKLLSHVARQALPGSRVVDAQQIESHLLALFHDQGFLSRPEVAPVREYLNAGGSERDAIDRRRCQLALQLGPLFEEYAASRTAMVEAWQTGTTLTDPIFAATEVWQRALWMAIFGPGGRIEERSRREGVVWLRIDQLLDRAESRGALALQGLGTQLHLFGASYVAPSYHRMLDLLGRHIEVVLYTLNPCREFWEDVETAGEVRRRLAKTPATEATEDPFGLLDTRENLPLRLWGRPGRENLRLLNLMEGSAFEEHFAPTEGKSLLACLQNDILDRVVRQAPDPELRDDGSLQVLACPGLRRELEVVAAEIWRCLREDPSLRCNDIAVIVPEASKEAYLAQVSAVFGESHDLPHHVVDLPLQSGHRLGAAMERLLELPFSSFSRKDLMPLLTHPSVMRRFPEAQARDWLRVVDQLGIVRGIDGRDVAGSYLPGDAFTWQQGLRRLALGAFMSCQPEDGPVACADGDTLPMELSPDDQDSALGMALLIRSLIADARFAAGRDGPAERPLSQWLAFIRGLLSSYLIPEDEAEEALLARCRATLDELDDGGLQDQPVGYRVAATLASHALLALQGGRGQYLARGVTVASFVPMRAIPFRVVFVLGLGQGTFPRSPRRTDIDLRQARRQLGDVTPREQDLYMFLETLLCVRDRLVLSYVGRDEITGETLPPSSLLLELREIFSTTMDAAALDHIFEAAEQRPPLRRHQDVQRLSALPLALAEHAAEELGRSLRQAVPAGCAAPASATELRRVLAPATFAEVAPRLGLCPITPAAPADKGTKIPINIIDLRRFLEDPLQASARFHLRLREEQSDDQLADEQDEPFASHPLGRASRLRQAITQALLASPVVVTREAVTRLYHEISLRQEMASQGPAGLFREAEAGEHLDVLESWQSAITALAPSGDLHARLLHFGKAMAEQSAREILPAITIPLEGGLTAEIQGATNLMIERPGQTRESLVFLHRSLDRRLYGKHWLSIFLDHVILAAADIAQDGHSGRLLLPEVGKNGPPCRRFAPLTATRARAYLRDLVQELLRGTPDVSGHPSGLHAYVLPCEAVFAHHDQNQPIVDAVEELRDRCAENDRTTVSTQYGPIRDALWRWAPPSPDEAERMVRTRFGLFFELVIPETP
jgi:exodeoxyribonuclease V gamma subunit